MSSRIEQIIGEIEEYVDSCKFQPLSTTKIVVNIAGGADLTLFEVNQAGGLIHELVDEDADIIFGNSIDDSLGEEIVVTIIATGFAGGKKPESAPAAEENNGADKFPKSVFDDDDVEIPSFLTRR